MKGLDAAPPVNPETFIRRGKALLTPWSSASLGGANLETADCPRPFPRFPRRLALRRSGFNSWSVADAVARIKVFPDDAVW